MSTKEQDSYKPNMFMGQEYPTNFLFYSWVYGVEGALQDGDEIGRVEPIESVYKDRPKLREAKIYFDQGTAISKVPKK